MPIRWKLFKIVCLLQMLIACFYGMLALIALFVNPRFYFLLEIIFFTLILSLAILGFQVLSNNYPDKPIQGKMKSSFNWLFLLNFLLLAFLSALIFSELNSLKEFAFLAGRTLSTLPIETFIKLGTNIVLLIFQLIILYGLYSLRRTIYINAMDKKFEFEGGGD